MTSFAPGTNPQYANAYNSWWFGGGQGQAPQRSAFGPDSPQRQPAMGQAQPIQPQQQGAPYGQAQPKALTAAYSAYAPTTTRPQPASFAPGGGLGNLANAPPDMRPAPFYGTTTNFLGQRTNPASHFAQRDAFIQSINAGRAPFAEAVGNGYRGPPPQRDFGQMWSQAGDMVSGGWQNPLAAQQAGGPGVLGGPSGMFQGPQQDAVRNLFAQNNIQMPDGFMDQLIGVLGGQSPSPRLAPGQSQYQLPPVSQQWQAQPPLPGAQRSGQAAPPNEIDLTRLRSGQYVRNPDGSVVPREFAARPTTEFDWAMQGRIGRNPDEAAARRDEDYWATVNLQSQHGLQPGQNTAQEVAAWRKAHNKMTAETAARREAYDKLTPGGRVVADTFGMGGPLHQSYSAHRGNQSSAQAFLEQQMVTRMKQGQPDWYELPPDQVTAIRDLAAKKAASMSQKEIDAQASLSRRLGSRNPETRAKAEKELAKMNAGKKKR